MAIDMKKTSQRLLEETYGKGNLGVFDELCAPGYRAHDPVAGELDKDGVKRNCTMYREAFPDLTPTILSSYTDGDVCVTRWRMAGTHMKEVMGTPPTGNRCSVEGISIVRFSGGRVAEDWIQWDALGLMRQISLTPSATAGTAKSSAMPQRHV